MSSEGMEPLAIVEESDQNEQHAGERSFRVPRVVAAFICAVALVSAFVFGRWSKTSGEANFLEPMGAENSAANDIIEMASSSCKPWCSKRKEDGTWCWKCNGFADSCGGCKECKDNNCAPADCQAWCAGQFKKKSVSQVCAMTSCAGCDKCPEPPVIKAASNYVCEVGKNYMGEAQEWAKGDNGGKGWTRAQCANKCNAQKGCRAYILSPGGSCFLKSNVGIVEHNKGGTLACRKNNYNPWGFICENGVNYVGHSKETHYGGTASMADCATKCRKANWCHVYVYHQGHKDCYIKDKVGKTDHNQKGTESCRDQTVTYSWR